MISIERNMCSIMTDAHFPLRIQKCKSLGNQRDSSLSEKSNDQVVKGIFEAEVQDVVHLDSTTWRGEFDHDS